VPRAELFDRNSQQPITTRMGERQLLDRVADTRVTLQEAGMQLVDRERILGLTSAPRPVPEGKTIYDVVEGTWPGEETDEEIRLGLERLS